MKPAIQLLILILFPVLSFSCKDKIEEVYTVNDPVYMTYDQLRTAVKSTTPVAITHPGKIYIKDPYLFINEYQKGIHVVDNSDPSAPRIVKFIEIPGNVDLAIRDNILYADSYVDLVALDISNLDDIHEVARVENVFPYEIPACDNGVISNVDESYGVVTTWKATTKKVEKGNNSTIYPEYPFWRGDYMTLNSYSGAAAGTGKTSTGTGGSLARFLVYDDILYCVNSYALKLFSVKTPDKPVFKKDVYVGWNVETLYPYQNLLFMGSTTGMYIYSLADPADPQYVAQFRHASSCDPVVVEGDYAYVTLRAGNLCGDQESQLDVIDIRDLLNPDMLSYYSMEEPYGLGVDDSLLFVCDGKAGLKIYSNTDPFAIDQHLIARYDNIEAYDVIAGGSRLILIGADGLYQFDYSDPAKISKLSEIPVSALISADR